MKRSKNKWDCKFKSGVMKINDKNIIFSKVGPKLLHSGDFFVQQKYHLAHASSCFFLQADGVFNF